MNIHHPDSELSRSSYRTGHSIGNIVKFKIKEHLKTAFNQLFYKGRTEVGEHFLTDLEPAERRIY